MNWFTMALINDDRIYILSGLSLWLWSTAVSVGKNSTRITVRWVLKEQSKNGCRALSSGHTNQPQHWCCKRQHIK